MEDSLKINNEMFQKHVEYMEKFEEIIVTYHDGHKKSFKPHEWAIFEDKVTKIAKNIEWIPIGKTERKSYSWIKLLRNLFFAVCIWMSVANMVQAFKCPEMTSSQLFIRTPYSFIMQWVTC